MSPRQGSSRQAKRSRLAIQVASLLSSKKKQLALAAIAAAAAGGCYVTVQRLRSFPKSNAGGYQRDGASRDAGATQGEKVPTNKKVKGKKGGGSTRRSPERSLRALLPLLLKVAGRKVLVVMLLAMARTAMSNRLARLQGYLFRAAFLRRVPLFARNMVENIILCGLMSVLEATTRSWVSYMELQWRQLLTKRLHAAYFNDMTYYKLNYVDRSIDSSEQRICEDVPKLSSGLADLTKEIISAIVDATFYTWQLQRYSGTQKYTAAILAYVFGAGALMTVAAPNFGRLFKKQQALEGLYRQLHSRLRLNAETIAFYNGIPKEGDLIRTKFDEVIAFSQKLLGKQWHFSMVQDFLLKYLGATAAVALIIGPFFGGHLRPEASISGRAQMLSNMRYHTSVIISLFAALGTLGASSRKFLRLGAYADRIQEMQNTMKMISQGGSMGKRDLCLSCMC